MTCTTSSLYFTFFLTLIPLYITYSTVKCLEGMKKIEHCPSLSHMLYEFLKLSFVMILEEAVILRIRASDKNATFLKDT